MQIRLVIGCEEENGNKFTFKCQRIEERMRVLTEFYERLLRELFVSGDR